MPWSKTCARNPDCSHTDTNLGIFFVLAQLGIIE